MIAYRQLQATIIQNSGQRTGRNTHNMQDTQVEVKLEDLEKEAPIQGSRLKSRFDNAEYERWSENLRNKARARGK
jgi:hypothetical protein